MPLIVQSDHTLMVEVKHPKYTDCRDFLAAFAELEKSPEFIHTYRITPLSLWNAAALEIEIDEIFDGLKKYSRYDIPQNVLADLRDWYSVYGKLILRPYKNSMLLLEVKSNIILDRLLHEETVTKYWRGTTSKGLLIDIKDRGNIKHDLVKIAYPVKDLCGFTKGDDFNLKLLEIDRDDNIFNLRDYQKEAVEAFYHSGRETGGNGIIVLPCGSGKTIIGLATIARVSNQTLIISTNNVSVHQWRNELISKTDINPDDIGEFTGLSKVIKPITITTYQMLTYRKNRDAKFHNLDLFTLQNWGLILYDEVHMLPAPVFRATVDIQAKRRMGLTATLVREDGKEDEVFALIGPKRYDVPWKVLENKGFIAEAYCTEYRIQMDKGIEMDYALSNKRGKFRIAAENPTKVKLVKELINNHSDDKILVIGQFIRQIEKIAKELKLPIITGKTKNAEREVLYNKFRNGELSILVVSKVANFAVDLPDASVLIQVSGTYGSRQEEAQRLGRILRPKKKRSHFYSLVSQGTTEQDFSINRQMFLVEQGYKYEIRYF